MFSGFVVLWIVGGAAVCFGLIPMWADTWSPLRAQEAAAAGFTDSAEQQALMRQNHMIRAYTPRGIQALWLFWSLLFVWQLIKQQALLNLLDRIGRPASMLLVAALLLCSSGCRRPFEPVQLEVVGTNEEAFLIPLLGDSTKQAQTNSEEYLAKNLVQTKQVLMPQQWVPKGFETFGPHGVWQPAAVLIRVDRSPVTREWTADPMSGTSNRNEAIWVMTSDQVEFSTGWTCTARIPTREAAVKFLYNYPSGSIASVMDREVRAMVQTTFGAEVTDEPMEKLRTQATPHIQQVVKKVTDFFAERGLEITNLGISGGFVYKDAKIQAKLVELFNSEQEKAIATATALALQEAATGKANAVKAEALGESEAAKTRALGEAEAIKTRADAKAYEISKAKEDMQTFMELRRLELMKEQIEKWSGVYPIYYIGTDHPSTLLTLPSPQLKPAGE
jgi:regulator of protease activity HflC (stomatin/prohibitin superfamily)